MEDYIFKGEIKMEPKHSVYNYLKEKGYEFNVQNNSEGISIVSYGNEIVIKGTKLDLIELADYVLDVALSNNDKDHIHIDEFSLVDKDSEIKSLIIEK